jgi:pyruvate/2-oxoglutarate dehydrogenase complex dihydrolipoamide dehydrogenase (E3) component
VITVGKIWNPELAEKILAEGKADFVAMGRALLADPELPQKAREGRLRDIRRCIYCNNCMNRHPHPDYLGVPWPACTVNTALGHGKEFDIKPAASSKKIMVIGGGVGGMEAARVLAERGHKVSLYEKESSLGGQFGIAAQQPLKKAYASLIEYQINGLNKSGVKIFLNTEISVSQVNKAKPDAVVVATGARPMVPDIPGVYGKNVVQINDFITGKAEAGDKVLIAGGRFIAMEVALQLMEQGKKVSLATRHLLGGNETTIERNLYRELRNRLFNGGVQIFENAPVVEVRDDGAYILFHKEQVFLYVDTVIMAVGVEPNNKLIRELSEAGHRVYAIGDCVKPRDALLATREGAEVGREI